MEYLEKEFDDELYEMELSQNRWKNKTCVMVFFNKTLPVDDKACTQHLQSQSILHQINDLVLETCYKYERFK